MKTRLGHPPPALQLQRMNTADWIQLQPQSLQRSSSGNSVCSADWGQATSLSCSPLPRRTSTASGQASPTRLGRAARQSLLLSRTVSDFTTADTCESLTSSPVHTNGRVATALGSPSQSQSARTRLRQKSYTNEALVTPPDEEVAVPQEPASPAAKAKQRQLRSRPWRKPQAECQAEIAEAERILNEGSAAAKAAGVDAAALHYCLQVQEVLEEDGRCNAKVELSGRAELQLALDNLRQVATNAQSPEEIQSAKKAVASALATAGVDEPVCRRTPSDACHQVLPGLLLGGWSLLGKDGAELKKRRVTHVVSVVSAEQQQLPAFVRGHLHITVHDKEDAAAQLAEHFPEICRFIEAARNEPRSMVFVHCGAGISRAPTAAASYIMWKLGIPAALAIKLIRAARPNIRPNVGFVRQLKHWESKMSSLDGYASGAGALLSADLWQELSPQSELPTSPCD
eukprot:TRINITY_DN44505_c0_g1_i1.p1 TRINITY_DN44505_c0_g1~~TRINITY_DN44505_c0_g1_i1.p1  ORF type:complete len:467 (+),score=108.20 TRINITY_DN44505_c0_g1_i1:34-1401(+)